MMTVEKNIKVSIRFCRPNGNPFTFKCLTYSELFVFKAYKAFIVYFTNHITGSIFIFRNSLGKQSFADSITTGRCLHLQRLMRSLCVVYNSPCIKNCLAMANRFITALCYGLSFQRPMKSFIFTHGLGMAWATMAYSNSKFNKPYSKFCVRIGAVALIAPGRAIIHEHPPRKPIGAKHFCKLFLHGLSTFIRARCYTQRIPGMIIKHSQRIATPILSGKMPFKIHLPQVIRGLGYKTLPCCVLLRLLFRNISIAFQNSCHRAWRRYCRIPQIFKPSLQLSSAPGFMLLPKVHNQQLCCRRSSMRTSPGPSGSVPQFLHTALFVPVVNPIPSLAAYIETPAEFRKIGAFLQNKINEFLPLRHYGYLFPAHDRLLSRIVMSIHKGVTYVSERLLPISPVYTRGD